MAARWLFFFDRSLTTALFTEMKAISEPEKNADSTTNTMMVTNPRSIQIIVWESLHLSHEKVPQKSTHIPPYPLNDERISLSLSKERL
jgi:hypothetical protein